MGLNAAKQSHISLVCSFFQMTTANVLFTSLSSTSYVSVPSSLSAQNLASCSPRKQNFPCRDIHPATSKCVCTLLLLWTNAVLLNQLLHWTLNPISLPSRAYSRSFLLLLLHQLKNCFFFNWSSLLTWRYDYFFHFKEKHSFLIPPSLQTTTLFFSFPS